MNTSYKKSWIAVGFFGAVVGLGIGRQFLVPKIVITMRDHPQYAVATKRSNFFIVDKGQVYSSKDGKDSIIWSFRPIKFVTF